MPSGWQGVITIGPAFHDFGPVPAGRQVSATLEQEPSGGEVPRPNERWFLTRIYCPVGVAVGGGSVTQADITVSLAHHGTPAWLTALTIPLIVGATSANSSGNGVVAIDFNNPLELKSGETPFDLVVSITPSADVPNNLFVFTGYRVSSVDPAGLVTQVPTPGSIAYTGYDLASLS